MSWIKRNLFFVIGSVAALALMGCAGWYLYSQWNHNQKTQQTLDETYAQIDQLIQHDPTKSPGTPGGKVDNIKNADEQIKQLREISLKVRERFTRIPPIPNAANVTGVQFATTLPGVIAQLEKAAAAASVNLPPQYSFSFQAQLPLPKFAPGSLGPLSVQLGEVKAICDVLFAAKINFLDSIRRERVSADDEAGTQADYLEEKSVTSATSVLTPYEVTFRCFGSELTSVLAGFARSPYCFLVRSVDVEPATEVAVGVGEQPTGAAPPYRGMRGGGGGATTPPPTTTAGMNKGGLPIFLDEKQIKVTMMLEIVKLNPKR